MKFAIITHVNHVKNEGNYFGYAPYIREMDIWLKYVDEVIIVAPSSREVITPIDLAYNCLLYTSPSPRDRQKSRMPSSA